MRETANGRHSECGGRAKNSARPARGCCLSPLAPILSRGLGMAASLTRPPRSIRIHLRNVARKQTRLKTGAGGRRVKSHHWRAEFFALGFAGASPHQKSLRPTLLLFLLLEIDEGL